MRLSAISKKAVCLIALCGFSLATFGCSPEATTPGATPATGAARKRPGREQGNSNETPGAETSAPPENEKGAGESKAKE